MVHILPLINTPGFTPEFDKENGLHIKKRNGLLIEGASTGHGIYERHRWWYGNGQISSNIDYKNGQPHGRYRRWRDNCKLTRDEVWENGKRVRW